MTILGKIKIFTFFPWPHDPKMGVVPPTIQTLSPVQKLTPGIDSATSKTPI